MKTNLLRSKLALAVGLSVVVLFGVVAYAQSLPTILGFGDTPYSSVVDGPARLTTPSLVSPSRLAAARLVAFNDRRKGSSCGRRDVARRES